MGDFVARRHSAVMERLRRRIQLIRQHHSSCSSRYQGAALERLEPERQQTLALHQRCLQTKAKRASKHRPPPPPANATGGAEHRQNAAAGGNAAAAAEHGGDGAGGGGGGAEQSRNSTLLALQETVKRKLEAGSPLDHRANGFDGFPQNKKPHLGNGTSNGTSPLEPKPGPEAPPSGGGGEAGPGPGPDFHPKEMKQEPEDILPIMPPSGGGASSLFPDLNLNEQEWKELMEELSHSVAMEDIQDILNDGFEDRKDPLELQAPPPGGGQLLAPPPGPAPLLPPVKAEFSPAAFEPDAGSPLLRGPASGSPGGAGSSPGGVASQQGGVASHQRHLLPPPPGPKDLSPAQQLQQLAAQQRVQQFHKMPHKPPQPGAKFPPQGPHPGPQGPHPPQWGPFGLDKPSYPQDFPPGQKKLLLAPQPKGSPKGPSGYLQGPPAHMLGHAPLGHAPPASASSPMLTYNNTRPLSHFEAPPRGPGPPQARGGGPQDKVALLSLIRQKNSLGFRQQQDQNSYPAPPHGPAPANAMAPGPGNNPMAAQPGPGAMAGNHGNAAYMSSQAAALKQQQYLQRQQLMAEQEKQRQQDQQLQRHLTRPPPQYQDQPGPPANQNPFPTQNQFPASSQPMGGVGSMGGPSPGARMFPQNQGGLMGMSLGQGGASGGGVAPPPAASQPDISLPSCGGVGGGGGVDVLYNNMNLHAAPAGLQRQPLGAMSPAYRQNLLAQRPNAAMMKQQQQQLAAANRMPNAMMGAMQGGQNAAWQQQLAAPPPTAANAFGGNANAFHMQPRPKMASGPAPFGGRMMQRAPHNPQTMGQPMANQQPAPQQQAGQGAVALADMAAFGQQGGARQGLPCNQGYQVSRAPPGGGGGQQQVSFGYNVASGSFAAESELVDSLLKGQSTQEWMADLDELLASHQ